MTIELPGYGTGLLFEWDSRNEDYPVSALLDPAQAPVSKKWNLVQRVNQGNEPKCVGAALSQELNAEPVVIQTTYPGTMNNIYNLAQKLDEWPGEGYAGTSLLGGYKALQQYGYIAQGGYRWAFTVDDVLLSLSQLGPVTMAGPWLTGMFAADSQGHIQVNGTSSNVGHCYLLGEIDVAQQRVYVEQTWGPNWTVLGWRGWFSFQDVDQLLRMGTQAGIITARLDPTVPPPPPPPVPPTPPVPTKTYEDGLRDMKVRAIAAANAL